MTSRVDTGNAPRILALDLGTTSGWAQVRSGLLVSGVVSFRGGRYEGGGMRFVRFQRFLSHLPRPELVVFEEVRQHKATDAAHVYGGLMATLTSWCEEGKIPYEGVPVADIKRFAAGRGNANKEAVIEGVRKLGHKPHDDNEADAIALALLTVERFK